jgi:translation initiation factor IF-2
VIHSGVWNVNLWDILMCEWSAAILIAFGVSIDTTAANEIENAKIEFINSKIIYHITERIEKIVSWMLDPKEIEVKLCEAKVWGIFYTDKKFMIVGLIIKEEDTSVEKWALIRVLRKDKYVWKWEVKLLKQWVEEVNKVEWPTECGIKFKWDCAVEMGDILEIYKIERS